MLAVIHTHRNLHEKLSCHSVLLDEHLIDQIQGYLLYYLTYYQMISALSKDEAHEPFEFHVSLSADGAVLSEQSPAELREAIMKIGEYDQFDLEVRYHGLTGDLYKDTQEAEFYYPDNLNNYSGLYEYLTESSDSDFDYSVIAYYEDYDEFQAWLLGEAAYDDPDSREEPSFDDLDLEATNDFAMLFSFDFEHNREQYDRIRGLIEEFADEDDDFPILHELWEEGEWVGFENLAQGLYNVGEVTRLAEQLSEVIKEVDGEVDVQLNGTLFDLEDMKCVQFVLDEEQNIVPMYLDGNL